MKNTFDNYIEERCEQALFANKEFRDIQNASADAYKRKDIEKYCELSMRMLTIAESTSYKLGIRDFNSLLTDI